MVAAIVLTGGASVRMGTPKALLTVDGTTFVNRVVAALDEGGCSEIVVVTGPHHEVISRQIDHGRFSTPASVPGQPVGLATSGDAPRDRRRLRIVKNARAGADQFSSLRLGLEAVTTAETDAVVMALVDHPLVAAATIRALVDSALASRAPVVQPAFCGRRGHPVVFGREAFSLLATGDLPGGARDVVLAFASRRLVVDIDDEGVVTDVDTPDDYRVLRGSDATLV